MAGVPVAGNDSVLRSGISWREYGRLRLDPANRNLRMTFSQGMLEIASPSQLHERISYLIGRLIDVWTEVHGIDCIGARATMLHRKTLDFGLEPDNCYYIQKEQQLRDEETDQLIESPAPDLAIEVEVKSPAVEKLSLYALLKVPEVWYWHAGQIEVLVLTPPGTCSVAVESESLPGFPMDLAVELLERRRELGNTAIVREFRRAMTGPV